MTLKHPRNAERSGDDIAVAPHFSLETTTIPRHALPDGEMPPDVAYQIVHDELMLDGNARRNVTERQAARGVAVEQQQDQHLQCGHLQDVALVAEPRSELPVSLRADALRAFPAERA